MRLFPKRLRFVTALVVACYWCVLHVAPAAAAVTASRLTGTTTITSARDADLLAFELLAPSAVVLAQWAPTADATKLATLLTNDFGLPPCAACEYAALLCPSPTPPDPLLRQFRESAESCRTSAGVPGTVRGEQVDGRA